MQRGNLDKMMIERGLTDYKVSKGARISQSSLSGWKHGKGQPKYNTLLKIAEFFDCTVDYLLGNVTYPSERLGTLEEAQEFLDALDKYDTDLDKFDAVTMMSYFRDLDVMRRRYALTLAHLLCIIPKEESFPLEEAFAQILISPSHNFPEFLRKVGEKCASSGRTYFEHDSRKWDDWEAEKPGGEDT